MTLTKLILIVVIICIIDYPLLNLSLKEEAKAHGGITPKEFLILIVMLLIVPLIITTIVLAL